MRTLILAGLLAIATAPAGAQVPLSLDTTFRCTRISHSGLGHGLPFADGSIIVTGHFIVDGSFFPVGPVGWMKLLPNGDIDESFPRSSAGRGKPMPFGPYYYTSGSGSPRRAFQVSGAFDPSYNPGTANYPYPNLHLNDNGQIHIQEDGKVLMTGRHWLVNDYGINPASWYSLLRLNTDATLDSTYQFRRTTGTVWRIQPTVDNKLLISGVFNTYEGLPANRILRIYPDGSLDTTFHTPVSGGYAFCFLEQDDGKIIAGGQFVLDGEPDTLHLIRLMPNGALDTSFHNHVSYKRLPYLIFGDFSHSVLDLEALEDGTIIVSGNFTHIDGHLRRGVALVDSLGDLLHTAFTGQGAGLAHQLNSTFMWSSIASIEKAPDGSIFLIGSFHGFDDGLVNDTAQRMVCKLHGLNVGIKENATPLFDVHVFPNPGDDLLHVSTDLQGRMEVLVSDGMGRLVGTINSPDGNAQLKTEQWASGLYLIRITTSKGSRTVKWTKR